MLTKCDRCQAAWVNDVWGDQCPWCARSYPPDDIEEAYARSMNVLMARIADLEDALKRIAEHGPTNQVCRASAVTCRDTLVNIAQTAMNGSDGRDAPACKCAMTPNTFCPVHGERPPPYGSNQSKGTNA